MSLDQGQPKTPVVPAARTVSISGAPASSITTISQDVGLYPGVAYNPSTNHFAVSVDKPICLGIAGALENEAIRPHVNGRFVRLLHAVERHPA